MTTSIEPPSTSKTTVSSSPMTIPRNSSSIVTPITSTFITVAQPTTLPVTTTTIPEEPTFCFLPGKEGAPPLACKPGMGEIIFRPTLPTVSSITITNPVDISPSTEFASIGSTSVPTAIGSTSVPTAITYTAITYQNSVKPLGNSLPVTGGETGLLIVIGIGVVALGKWMTKIGRKN